jgi:hypothetical protein
LSRYETRLRDVVRAYKGLAKEKEALEKSLAALSGQKDEAEANEVPQEAKAVAGKKAKAAAGDQSDNESVASSADEVQPDVRNRRHKHFTSATYGR